MGGRLAWRSPFSVYQMIHIIKDNLKQKPVLELWREDEFGNRVCQGKSYADYLMEAGIIYKLDEDTK